MITTIPLTEYIPADDFIKMAIISVGFLVVVLSVREIIILKFKINSCSFQYKDLISNLDAIAVALSLVFTGLMIYQLVA